MRPLHLVTSRRGWRGASLAAAAAGAVALSLTWPAGPAAAAAPAAHILLAWGSNDGGQLGSNVSSSSLPVADSPVGVDLPDGASVVAAAAGDHHGLAADSAGGLLTWGTNNLGQLGDGNMKSTDAPTELGLVSGGVSQVSAGAAFSLALTTAGQVLAWGGNGSGQLGDNSTTTSPTPITVQLPASLPAGTTATAISAGTAFSLALTTAGQVLAWGGNKDGELGNGSTNGSKVPALVSLPGRAVAVAAGGTFGLALLSTGQVYAWGSEALGNGAQSAKSPVPVSLPAAASAIGAGGETGYALTGSGAFAWGAGGDGQLGNGNTADSATPVKVSLAPGTTLTAISGAAQSAVGLTSTGAVLTWGTGDLGAGGTVLNSDLPVATELPAGEVAVAIGAGPVATSALALMQPAPVTAPPAAPPAPTLSCEVIPNVGGGQPGPSGTGTCGPKTAASSYVLDFAVANGGGSFAWTGPADSSVTAGCTASTPFCDVTVHASTADESFTASVVADDTAGTPFTLTATAEIPAVCQAAFC